jgi:HD-like signal output (HDOD) protein
MQMESGSINYEYLVNQIQRNLPTLPTIVNELTNVLQNPDASTFAVEDVMTADQSMTMKILRVANTSFYRQRDGNALPMLMKLSEHLALKKFVMLF